MDFVNTKAFQGTLLLLHADGQVPNFSGTFLIRQLYTIRHSYLLLRNRSIFSYLNVNPFDQPG